MWIYDSVGDVGSWNESGEPTSFLDSSDMKAYELLFKKCTFSECLVFSSYSNI